MLLGSNLRIGNMSTLGGVLPPFTASDNFSGVYPNSGSVGDASWNDRWTVNSGAWDSITSGKLKNTDSGAVTNELKTKLSENISGDFSCSVLASADNFPTASGDNNAVQLLYVHFTNGKRFLAGFLCNTGEGFTNNNGHYFAYSPDSISQSHESEDFSDVTINISRVGSTVTGTIGSNTYQATEASDVDYISLFQTTVSSSWTAYFDDFTLVDGSGDPILI